MGQAGITTVCLVEDDPAFAEELIHYLSGYGMKIIWLQTLTELEAQLPVLQPDALLLDQFVDGHDALTMIVRLRASYTGGIMVLTGTQEVLDRIVALETGADDFVSKLLGAREILARLRSVLRRAHQPVSAPPPPSDAAPGRWRIYPAKHELWAPDGTLVRLSMTEFRALMMLVENGLSVVSRSDLSAAVLHRPFRPMDRSIDNLLSRIRKMIEHHTNGVPVIRSVRGLGYMFTGLDLQYDPPSAQPGPIEPKAVEASPG